MSNKNHTNNGVPPTGALPAVVGIDAHQAQQALLAQYASTAHLGSLLQQLSEQLDTSRKAEHEKTVKLMSDFNDSMFILFENLSELNQNIVRLIEETRQTRGVVLLHNERLKALQEDGVGEEAVQEKGFPKVTLQPSPAETNLAPVMTAAPNTSPFASSVLGVPRGPQTLFPAPAAKKKRNVSPEGREAISRAAKATQARRKAAKEAAEAAEAKQAEQIEQAETKAPGEAHIKHMSRGQRVAAGLCKRFSPPLILKLSPDSQIAGLFDCEEIIVDELDKTPQVFAQVRIVGCRESQNFGLGNIANQLMPGEESKIPPVFRTDWPACAK